MDNDRPTPPNNPWPPFNPFASPPEPERTIAEALQVAYARASGEWAEYLPHGLPEAEYGECRPSWLIQAAVQSATVPLDPILPAPVVAELAQALALAAFYDVAGQLSLYEPDYPIAAGPFTDS